MEMVLFPMNLVFALESGDIGFASGGLFPKRKHGVVQGVYTKLGNRIENPDWTGQPAGPPAYLLVYNSGISYKRESPI